MGHGPETPIQDLEVWKAFSGKYLLRMIEKNECQKHNSISSSVCLSWNQLNQDRIDKLEAIGFVWKIRNRPEWDRRFQELKEYLNKYGDTKVPQHYRENKGLGKWVAKQVRLLEDSLQFIILYLPGPWFSLLYAKQQREQYKNRQKGKHSFLTPDRLEKLESIGFIWQVRNPVPTEEDEHVVDPQHHHVVNHAHPVVAHAPGPPMPPLHHHHHHHHLPL